MVVGRLVVMRASGILFTSYWIRKQRAWAGIRTWL